VREQSKEVSLVLVSTKSHNNGNVVAQVFRGDEGVGEFFSIDFVSASSNAFFTPRCKSQGEAEYEADRRLRDEGHQCSNACSANWSPA
jgi:hypothetical protein